jgi:hypothetical protein
VAKKGFILFLVLAIAVMFSNTALAAAYPSEHCVCHLHAYHLTIHAGKSASPLLDIRKTKLKVRYKVSEIRLDLLHTACSFSIISFYPKIQRINYSSIVLTATRSVSSLRGPPSFI